MFEWSVSISEHSSDGKMERFQVLRLSLEKCQCLGNSVASLARLVGLGKARTMLHELVVSEFCSTSKLYLGSSIMIYIGIPLRIS